MRALRRKEKLIENEEELQEILGTTQYITIAMTMNNQPYLVTLSHGYDRENHCIYFHGAKEGKKNEFLQANNIVWGQALIDRGYVPGKCDHLYSTVHFKGTVSFIADFKEKRHALEVMVHQLENEPQNVIETQITEKSVARVNIGRIDIEYMSGKESKTVVVSI